MGRSRHGTAKPQVLNTCHRAGLCSGFATSTPSPASMAGPYCLYRPTAQQSQQWVDDFSVFDVATLMSAIPGCDPDDSGTGSRTGSGYCQHQ